MSWGAPSTLLRAPRYVERSLTVASILFAVGMVLVATGVLIGHVVGTVIATFGGVLLTVAILSILYDAYLKDVLLGEIYHALSIQQNVQAVDLRQLLQKEQLDLDRLLSGASTIMAVPLDPETWSRTDWQHVVNYAASQIARVTVFLPNHESPHIDALAQRLGVQREELVDRISSLPDQLAQSWDEKVVNTQSCLQICLYRGVPAAGILTTDNSTMIEIPPTLAHAAIDRTTLAVVLGRDGSSTLITDFVDSQLTPNRIPGFSRSVMRPLEESVSPDPPRGSHDPT